MYYKMEDSLDKVKSLVPTNLTGGCLPAQPCSYIDKLLSLSQDVNCFELCIFKQLGSEKNSPDYMEHIILFDKLCCQKLSSLSIKWGKQLVFMF